MDADSKKREERRIFDLVYSDQSFNDVRPHENPDFLARQFPNSRYFGVEVTEYYVSETNARLDRIHGYSTQLLEGAVFRHKHDAIHLNVTQVDIVNPDDSIHAKDVPAIIQEMPPPAACARQVADRIVAKAKRIDASVADISHANLIVEDKTGLLRTIPKKDFCRIYFVPELVDAITSSPFREIFFVTTLEGEQVYARLKMLHLLAEAYLFNGALVQNGFAAHIPADIDESELFAAYLNDIAEAPVLVHRDSLGTEVIFGDSGLVIGNDKEVTVRLHSDFPISSDAAVPCVDWKSILGVRFHETMNEYRMSNSFSTEAVFPVKKGTG